MDEQKAPPEPSHQTGTGKGEEKSSVVGKEEGRKDTGTEGAVNRHRRTLLPLIRKEL